MLENFDLDHSGDDHLPVFSTCTSISLSTMGPHCRRRLPYDRAASISNQLVDEFAQRLALFLKSHRPVEGSSHMYLVDRFFSCCSCCNLSSEISCAKLFQYRQLLSTWFNNAFFIASVVVSLEGSWRDLLVLLCFKLSIYCTKLVRRYSAVWQSVVACDGLFLHKHCPTWNVVWGFARGDWVVERQLLQPRITDRTAKLQPLLHRNRMHILNGARNVFMKRPRLAFLGLCNNISNHWLKRGNLPRLCS